MSDDKENEPPVKKKRLSLSISSRRTNSERFSVPVTEEEAKLAAKGVTPINTTVANEWAVRNFVAWMKNRNSLTPNDPVPEDLLSCSNKIVLCKWLCRYVQETRKENGERYPASTIRSLLAAIQRVLRSNSVAINIFDSLDHDFANLHKTLDTVCVGLRKDGIGAAVKHAPIITLEHEGLLWESGVLGFSCPRSLLRAVFYTVGLHCCLRGGNEHRELKCSQFVRVPLEGYDADTKYVYTENGSKNYQGRFSETGQQNKIVHVYAQVDSCDRCPVRVIDFYFAKIHLTSDSSISAFYRQPKESSVPLGVAWYKNIPVGVNPLKNMMSQISNLAGLPVKYTNHSLRATSTTRMFTYGIPEKIVAEVTGHKSIKALRQYEQTTKEQLQEAGQAIAKCKSEASTETDCDEPFNPFEEESRVESKLSEAEAAKNICQELQKQTCFSGKMKNCTINFNF